MKIKILDVRCSIDDCDVKTQQSTSLQNRKSKIENRQFLVFGITMMVIGLMGCGPKRDISEPICEGKPTATQAIETLRRKQTGSLSFRAAVECAMEFTDAQNKMKRETFEGQLRFVEPVRMYLGGDKFGPIRIGTNQDEFWMYIKPAVDTAWWGRKADIPACVEKLGFNPFHLAEAMGRIELNKDWKLSRQEGIDILTLTQDGSLKKVYIDCCTYQVVRIEYYDTFGKLIASADIWDYQDIPQVGLVPGRVELRHFNSTAFGSTLLLKLSGISFFTPTPAQNKLFERPLPRGYKSVYRWTEKCEFVMESN